MILLVLALGGGNEETWPEILQNKYGINIVDLSKAGATASSAFKQAEHVNDSNAIVLLEIGGNDLFAPTPQTQFEKDLKRLIQRVIGPDRTVVMLELPLLPWQIRYGKIQRQLSREFDVVLIPKRFFVSVLSAQDATSDLAHLTTKGHRIMAERIWSLLGENLESSEVKIE